MNPILGKQGKNGPRNTDSCYDGAIIWGRHSATLAQNDCFIRWFAGALFPHTGKQRWQQMRKSWLMDAKVLFISDKITDLPENPPSNSVTIIAGEFRPQILLLSRGWAGTRPHSMSHVNRSQDNSYKIRVKYHHESLDSTNKTHWKLPKWQDAYCSQWFHHGFLRISMPPAMHSQKVSDPRPLYKSPAQCHQWSMNAALVSSAHDS